MNIPKPQHVPPTMTSDVALGEWEYLSHGAIIVERNRWFIATLVAGLIAAAAVAAVAMLVPLQKLVPLAVAIDSRTGLVTSVEYSKSETDLTQHEAIQRSDVARYVTARETYDPQDLATNTKLVRVMSDGNVWRQYESETSPYNDTSPIKRYGTEVRRRIDISTAVPLPGSSNTYQVRYTAFEDRPGSASPVMEAYIATVNFRYSDRSLSNEDRILNPLDFRAMAYRSDREVVEARPTPVNGAMQ